MKRDGFKRTAVLGLAVSALLMTVGCRQSAQPGQDAQQQGVQDQQQQAPGTGGSGQGGSGEEPADLNQLPEEEGFQSTPDEHELPSGSGLDGRDGPDRGQGGSGEDAPKDSHTH
jgi:hypothetical protein